ncbi:riboflavin synthase subunit alpha [Fusobacterium nucleatum]|uniref:Riboflavin synthase subunit alpha n=1 Tax=Fusobacterium nucleatum TaxID=851 RepID=A0A2N6TI91_FUSNU|nr:riboflavin synthase subunit alpha [Fusobacterium nucleatum]
MSRANLAVSEQSEFSEFAANVNFSSLRNLANNELFFISHYEINLNVIYYFYLT